MLLQAPLEIQQIIEVLEEEMEDVQVLTVVEGQEQKLYHLG